MNIKIGNTPMVKINYTYRGSNKYVYAKLESYNITGSIKDRVALFIINNAYKEKLLKKGQEIVEATSGNTGISLAALGTYSGNPVHIFMPDWASKERVELMKLYNAKVTLVSKEEGGFKGAIKQAKEYAKTNNAFYSNQFENPYNVEAHFQTTGEEIIRTINPMKIGAFVSGIGTGGTLMGISKKLKEKNKAIKTIALEPDKMPLLSKNKIISNHKIEGIGDDFIPKIVNKKIIDKIVLVNDEDSINMARKLSSKLGLGVGISSGANLIASIISKEEIDGEVITIFADDNKKYLSTDLTKTINVNKNFISNQVELISYEFI